MTIGTRIREARKYLGLTQTEFGRAAGVSKAAVSYWENEISAPERDSLMALKKNKGLSPEWIMAGVGSMYVAVENNTKAGPDIRGFVPLISRVQAGEYIEAIDNLQPGEGERIETTVPIKRYTYALVVDGDSMEPALPEGSILIVEPEMEPLHGDYVIVKNGEGGVTVKQLVVDGKELYLKAVNPRYPVNPMPKDAAICGVVRGMERRFR